MNKFFIIFFLLLYTATGFSSWEESPFSEDSNNQYWVGISNPNKNLKDAVNEAYNEAVKEAIKYNFGFVNSKFSESHYHTTKSNEFSQENKIFLPEVVINGVKPIRQKITETSSGFIVYKKISYKKSEINKEITRLKSNNKLNRKISSAETKLANVVFKTNPTNAKVTFIGEHVDSLVMSSNAYLNLPFGKYQVIIEKYGYKTIKKDILILGTKESNSFFYDLKANVSDVIIHTIPSDANIYINGIKRNKNNLKLPNGNYEISIKKDGFLSQSSFIDVSDHNSYFKFFLKPKSRTISFTTEPSNAKVYLNGDFIGHSPIINYPVSSNYNEINVIKKGFSLYFKSFKLTEINKKSINLILDESI